MNVLKYLGVAAIALSSLATAADAQTLSKPSPQALHQSIQPGVSNGHGTTGGSTTEFSGSGEYYRHCYEAYWYDDGANYYIFAYNLEGDYEYSSVPHAGSGNTITQTTLNSLCATGQGYYIFFSGSSFYEISEKAF